MRSRKENSPHYSEEVTEAQRTLVTFHDYMESNISMISRTWIIAEKILEENDL